MSPLTEYVVQAIVTLLGVGLLAWLVVFAGRRMGLQRDGGDLRLRGRLTLDARRALYLVEVSDKVLVLGASEAGLTKLAELDRVALPEVPLAATRSFSDVLATALGQKRKAPEDAEHANAGQESPPEKQRVEGGGAV